MAGILSLPHIDLLSKFKSLSVGGLGVLGGLGGFRDFNLPTALEISFSCSWVPTFVKIPF